MGVRMRASFSRDSWASTSHFLENEECNPLYCLLNKAHTEGGGDMEEWSETNEGGRMRNGEKVSK